DRLDGCDGYDREEPRGDERPADLERGAAVDLLRVLVLPLAVAVAEGDEHHSGEDELLEGRPYPERRHEEVVDLLGRGAVRAERVLPVVLGVGARTEDEGGP